MAAFIAQMIMNARKVSLANGQAKYRAYFISLNYYKRYQADVDAILIAEDCEDCIVTA